MHFSRVIVPLLPIVFVFAAADASAQDKGKTGVVMGYPTAVGFVTHITERVAIRPDLNVNFGTTTTAFPFGDTTIDGSTLGVGFSALVYLGKGDKLRPYVSPRYLFARLSTTSHSPFGGESETTLTSHTLGGFFGAQYALHDRFSVFGEVGVGYTVSRMNLEISEPRTESWRTDTRAAVGVIFYF